MQDTPRTPPSLLLRIRDGSDVRAWSQFLSLYGPLVSRFARRWGLQEADAADVQQLVFATVARAIGRFEYDARRGSFRGWLMTITRNELVDFCERANRTESSTGGTAAQRFFAGQIAAAPDVERLWDEEYRRALFEHVVASVRPAFRGSTWDAFWQTALEGRPAADVATALGMSLGAVYVAKSRVLARLRDAVAEIEGNSDDIGGPTLRRAEDDRGPDD